MPRRGGSKPSGAPAGARGASTAALPNAFVRPAPPPPPRAAAPPQQHQQHAQAQAPPQTQTREPGIFGQMAATAGSVAAGSVIGHGISSMLFGGSSSHEATNQATSTPMAAAQPHQDVQNSQYTQGCESPAKEFTTCMKDNGDNLNACTWYLNMLNQCRSAASNY